MHAEVLEVSYHDADCDGRTIVLRKSFGGFSADCASARVCATAPHVMLGLQFFKYDSCPIPTIIVLRCTAIFQCFKDESCAILKSIVLRFTAINYRVDNISIRDGRYIYLATNKLAHFQYSTKLQLNHNNTH